MILRTVRRREATSFEIAKTLGVAPTPIRSKRNPMERNGILASYLQYKDRICRLADSSVARALRSCARRLPGGMKKKAQETNVPSNQIAKLTFVDAVRGKPRETPANAAALGAPARF